MNRRSFIKNSAFTAGFLSFGNFPLHATIDDDNISRITILHTNDVHSRLDPFPLDGSRNAGKGGVARRSQLIKQLRDRIDHTLLFDSGDILQGTPYFNFYGGEVEMKVMSAMGYDAGTLGNHDFDGGIDGFDRILPFANFPILVGNYDFKNTVLNGKIQEYKIFQKGEIKVGVFGIGIELEGLVPKTLYKETIYLDPVKEANRIALTLKKDLKCDYIVCLSHLGYKYGAEEHKISDIDLAKNSKNIDLILGGHTHTFLREPTKETNLENKTVVINQAGFGGLVLGKIDLFFEKNRPGKCMTCENITIK
jgi:5'-nucleotidase